MLTRRHLLTSAAGALALVASPKCGPTNPPESLYQPCKTMPEAFTGASEPPTAEHIRQAVSMLQKNGVPPCQDGFYYLHHQRQTRRLSVAGELETAWAYKLRRFSERGYAARRRRQGERLRLAAVRLRELRDVLTAA